MVVQNVLGTSKKKKICFAEICFDVVNNFVIQYCHIIISPDLKTFENKSRLYKQQKKKTTLQSKNNHNILCLT